MAAAAKYKSLKRAQLSYEYLHTNSTTHDFLFGAIVELVDNARDAGAQTIYIDSEKNAQSGQPMLSFLDDGNGMDRVEAGNVITFGYSAKKFDPAMIGQYGNGLKSGAMRIGRDFIIFTKRADVLTCVMLSRSFHEEKHIEEVLVPMPSFAADKTPLVDADDPDALATVPPSSLRLARTTAPLQHQLELALLLKYSPFATEHALLAPFDRIGGAGGTLVLVYNLRLNPATSDTELNLSVQHDVRLGDGANDDSLAVPERASLRAYLAVVYMHPRMKIYIRGKKVQTRRILCGLYKPQEYSYVCSNFKQRVEKDLERSKRDCDLARQRELEAESSLADFRKRHDDSLVDKVVRTERRQFEERVRVAKESSVAARQRLDAKEKSRVAARLLRQSSRCRCRRTTKPELKFVFGINLEQRRHCGCMVYNNGRLIRMYEKVGAQFDGGVKGLGVVGVVDVPYAVLEPTHNKQNFADSREYGALLRALGVHLDQYWRDMRLAESAGGVLRFWQDFGYDTSESQAEPSKELTYRSKRFRSVKTAIQCDKCLKWRVLAFKNEYLNGLPEKWQCSDNPEKSCSKCDVPERSDELEKFKKGKLESASVETQHAKAEARLKKQQEKVERLGRRSTVASTKDARKLQQDAPVAKSRRVSPPVAAVGRRGSSPPLPRSSKPKTKAELRQMKEAEAKRRRRSAPSNASTTTIRVRLSSDDEDEDQDEHESRPAKRASLDRTAAKRTTAPTRTSGGSASAAAAPKPAKAAAAAGRQIRVAAAQSSSASPPITPTEVSSTTATEPDQIQEELMKRLRKLLCFFRPPQYALGKQEISALAMENLLKIDLNKFLIEYESSLNEVVSEGKQAAAAESNHTLCTVRERAAKLLLHINQQRDDISGPDDTSHRVDDALAETLASL